MTRPKRTKPDANQAQIVADLRAVGCRVDILSSLPGHQISEYDAIQVRPGEHIEDALDLLVMSPCLMHLVKVEIKTDWGASFRPGQQAYFRSLDEWPPENPRGKPAIVAYSAGDVLNWFYRRCGCSKCVQVLANWKEKR